MNQAAARYGLIAGVVLVMYNLLLYIMGMEVYTKWYLALLAYPIIFGFMIWGGLKLRSLSGGYLSYGKAYVGMLIIAAVAMLVGTVWNIVLYGFINTELAGIVKDAAIENMIGMMEKFGAPESAIEQAVQEQDAALEAQFTTMGFIKSFFSAMIFIAVINALLALIPKKNPPVTEGSGDAEAN